MPDGPLLQCVPNISEGRDRALLDALTRAIETAGARLIDLHADPDHHRSVFTFLGSAATIERAALELGREAVARIDLRRHTGAHPRIGAIDVVPFVPLAGSTMRDAVDTAHRTGHAFAAATGVPVFFYEEAARVPERRSLPAIRAGGFEMLAERLSGAEPDAGPPRPHPSAGATAVGARRALVAFNANLATADIAVARAIAAAVREVSPGGLPAVRAMGILLTSRGMAQVSMNLLDYRRTPPAVVIERVRQEAEKRRTGVVEYELVGCAPADAFPDGVAALVRGLRPSQLLDPALFAAG